MTPALVLAHLVTTGLGSVYDGILHFLLTPEDILPVLALSLFAGLRGPDQGRRVLFVLPAAWFAGGLVGLAAKASVPSAASAVSFLVCGGLLAAEAKLPIGATTALALLLGLFHGYANGAPKGGAPFRAQPLAGVAVTVFAVVALAAGLAAPLRKPAARIAARVAGSWIAAVGLLLLGWSLKRGA